MGGRNAPERLVSQIPQQDSVVYRSYPDLRGNHFRIPRWCLPVYGDFASHCLSSLSIPPRKYPHKKGGRRESASNVQFNSQLLQRLESLEVPGFLTAASRDAWSRRGRQSLLLLVAREPRPSPPRPWFLSRRTLCLLVVKMASASAGSPLPPLPLSSQFAATAIVATTATSAAARESELRRSTFLRP